MPITFLKHCYVWNFKKMRGSFSSNYYSSLHPKVDKLADMNMLLTTHTQLFSVLLDLQQCFCVDSYLSSYDKLASYCGSYY
jgi:hypothetical protein